MALRAENATGCAHGRPAPYLGQPPSLPFESREQLNWIDFSQTLNPLGTPHALAHAMLDAQRICEQGAAVQAEGEFRALERALSRYHGVAEGCVFAGATIGSLLSSVAASFEPCCVGVAVPARAAHIDAVRKAGHRLVEIEGPTRFVTPDPAAARRRGGPFDAAILANPTFPSSRLLPREVLGAYLESCAWVVVDERSIDLTLNGESMAPLVRDWPNLVVVRTFTESLALPGMPISYCIAQPEAVARIAEVAERPEAPALARTLGELAVEQATFLDRTNDLLDAEIPWLQCMLNLVPGVDIFPAEANYVLCTYDVSPEMELGAADVHELVARLQTEGFLVREMGGAPGLTDRPYFCVAVRTRPDNEKLIAALRRIVLGR